MRVKPLRLLCLLSVFALLAGGCQSKTFAGFTYGGGGNTFSAESARYSEQTQGFQMEAGQASQSSYLLLTCDSREFRKPAKLISGQVRVPGHDMAKLVGGEVVLQAQQGTVIHGSFEVVAKSQDGREFEVVGSFTADVIGADL